MVINYEVGESVLHLTNVSPGGFTFVYFHTPEQWINILSLSGFLFQKDKTDWFFQASQFFEKQINHYIFLVHSIFGIRNFPDNFSNLNICTYWRYFSWVITIQTKVRWPSSINLCSNFHTSFIFLPKMDTRWLKTILRYLFNGLACGKKH